MSWQVEVKMSVQYMSFSAHADAKGIMQLIRQCEPKNVMLVHGEAAKMDFLKNKIHQEFGNAIRLTMFTFILFAVCFRCVPERSSYKYMGYLWTTWHLCIFHAGIPKDTCLKRNSADQSKTTQWQWCNAKFHLYTQLLCQYDWKAHHMLKVMNWYNRRINANIHFSTLSNPTCMRESLTKFESRIISSNANCKVHCISDVDLHLWKT